MYTVLYFMWMDLIYAQETVSVRFLM